MGQMPHEDAFGNNTSASVEQFGLSYVRPQHREIARRLVLGQNSATISRVLNLSQSRLSIIINSPLFKRELKKLEAERDASATDVTKTLRELSPIALEQMERTMYNGKSERLRFDAAATILDRAGYGAVNKSIIGVTGNVNVSHQNLTEDEIKQLLEERLDRISKAAEFKEAEAAELNATQIEFEKNNVCSDSEQLNKIAASMFGEV